MGSDVKICEALKFLEVLFCLSATYESEAPPLYFVCVKQKIRSTVSLIFVLFNDDFRVHVPSNDGWL
jgi:hypothetical protein